MDLARPIFAPILMTNVREEYWNFDSVISTSFSNSMIMPYRSCLLLIPRASTWYLEMVTVSHDVIPFKTLCMKSYLVVLHGGKHCPSFLREFRNCQRKDFASLEDKFSFSLHQNSDVSVM